MRQANPMRGARLLVSAFINCLGNEPVKGPLSPEITGTAAVNSGVTSRFTICPDCS
jgi:hypothetical protein